MKISRTNALFVATEVAYDQASDNPGYDDVDDDNNDDDDLDDDDKHDNHHQFYNTIYTSYPSKLSSTLYEC